PVTDAANCKACGDCAKACPMGAMVLMEVGDKQWIEHRPQRCIGCGLCVVACQQKAKTLREVPDYREPAKSVLSYMSRFALSAMSNAFHVFRSRRRK
ncbi:MAG: 4Fe-4S binding protein, partial [Actinobacteria bacterium]|nr:4Fe-4S binding protein [Actinomycetota bacterium]